MSRSHNVWSTFIALDENKADPAWFLSDVIMIKGKYLPERYEVVTGGGFINATDARSTTRNQIKLSGNEANTRLILYACEAADRGYEWVLVICRDTVVLLLLVHFMPVVEVWMITETVNNRKCYPVQQVSQRLLSLWWTTYSASIHWQAVTLLQPSVVTGISPAVKHSRSLQLEMPWNFMQYVLTTRQISDCKQTKNT